MNENLSYFKSSVESDIYIGKGAGKKLLHDIENAQKSVKIVSPFLSPDYIKILIGLKERGLDIKLITSDEIEDYKDRNKIIYQLIKQIVVTDRKSEIQRDKLIKLKNWYIASFVLSIFLSISLGYFASSIFYYGLILSALLCLTLYFTDRMIRYKRIYNYHYEQLFPFKVFISPQRTNYSIQKSFYIHSKIYIIDDTIAYFGSVNFSKSGFFYNFESRIRITDKETISELKNLFEELFENKDNISIPTEFWGKQLYREPIN